MALTEEEFNALLNDRSKRIETDISWSEDEDHSPTVEFRVKVESEPCYPLFVKGSYNAMTKTLSYTIVHKQTGRVYALDMGKDHRNPDGELVGEKHKHRWSEKYRDKHAYAPPDITAPASDPVAVWEQFCKEALIEHRGIMNPPPPVSGRLVL